MEKRNTVFTQSPLAVPMVRKLLHRGARSALARMLSKVYPVDVARLLATLGTSERIDILSILLDYCSLSFVADVLSEMSPEDALSLLESLDPRKIAGILGELPPDDATSLASRLPEPLAAEVFALMEPEPAADIRELLEHEAKSAGRIMTQDFFAMYEDVTVSETITALQRRSEEFEMVFYVYVVDNRGHLVGVVSLKKLLTSHPSTQLKRIMVPEVVSAPTNAPQEEVARLVAEYNLLAIPIVDEERRLVGIVTVDDVIDVLKEEAAEDLLALAGVTKEERVSTSPMRALRLRAPWLLVNLVTAFFASLVVSMFEGPISRLPALAVLMPIVGGMGGNAATQTVTVIIRGMALGEIVRVGWACLKAVIVGIGNGAITGVLAAAAAALYYNDPLLGVVLAMAMVANQVVAGLLGTLIPVVLRRLQVDPAVSSSVFITPATDAAGFFSFLGLATVFMGLLG